MHIVISNGTDFQIFDPQPSTHIVATPYLYCGPFTPIYSINPGCLYTILPLSLFCTKKWDYVFNP